MAIGEMQSGAALAPAGSQGEPRHAERPAGFRDVVVNVAAILCLAAPQKYWITLYVALYFCAAFVQTVGLASFNSGFAVMGGEAPAVPPETAWAGKLFEFLGVPREAAWLAFFSAFLVASIMAYGIDHLGWIVRLKLLSEYEADQTMQGLRLIKQVDPRSRIKLSHREMVIALRGDCKSARIVLQMILVSAVAIVQVSLPLVYIFSLDSGMALLGLLILLLGFYPILRLARRAGGMSLLRQQVDLAAGSNVSSLLATVTGMNLAKGTSEQAIRDIRRAIMQQQLLWRKQYEIRSLSQKVPQLCSLFGTYIMVMWGVGKVQAGLLNWGGLMTFTVAARLVFQPFTIIGKNWAKSAENYPRAIRYLAFVQLLRRSRQLPDDRVAFRGPVNNLSIRRLSLPSSNGQSSEQIDVSLERGSILAIVDRDVAAPNRLIRCLSGSVLIDSGDICLDGLSLNHLQYQSIVDTIQSPGRATSLSGTMLQCAQALQPDASAPALSQFARDVLREQYSSWMPRGTDSILIPERRKDEPGMTARYSVLELYDLHCRHRGLLLIDFAQIRNAERRATTLNYICSSRSQFITIWIDSGHRQELGEQTIAAFRGGAFLGIGNVEWFKETFPDWDNVPSVEQRPNSGLIEFGAIEAIESDLLLEEEGGYD